MGVHLTREQKHLARRLRTGGLKLNEIARELNTTLGTVSVTVKGAQERPGKEAEWTPAPGRLSFDERVVELPPLQRTVAVGC